MTIGKKCYIGWLQVNLVLYSRPWILTSLGDTGRGYRILHLIRRTSFPSTIDDDFPSPYVIWDENEVLRYVVGQRVAAHTCLTVLPHYLPVQVISGPENIHFNWLIVCSVRKIMYVVITFSWMSKSEGWWYTHPHLFSKALQDWCQHHHCIHYVPHGSKQVGVRWW